MLARIILVGAILTGAWAYLMHRPPPPALGGDTPSFLTGAFHIHSAASHDGRRDLASIIAAAIEANLDFIVVTDHNVTAPEPLVLGGLTVLAYPEVSTSFGHVIQLGLREPIPKEERHAANLTTRMRAYGAAPIIAHPSRWRRPWEGPWNQLGGIEIANTASTLWRGGKPLLDSILLAGPNPKLAKATLYARDERSIARWDEQPDPTVGGYCSVDSHGWLPLRHELGHWKIQLEVPVPDVPAERAQAIERALLEARFHCIAGIAQGGSGFAFEARSPNKLVGRGGDTIEAARVTALVARAPKGAHSLTLYRNGDPVVRTTSASINYRGPLPGSYRVEAAMRIASPWLGHHAVPISYSNKIRIVAPAH